MKQIKCPHCQTTLTVEIEKVSTRSKAGLYRAYSCAICGWQANTFQPSGHKETIVKAKNEIRLCECGEVALHSKTVQVTGPTARVTVSRTETLDMCDACLKIEQQVRPTPVERRKAAVVWRAVYSC